ncbi:MAG: hypothetical protein GXO70_05395 [Acidobacteria bacterium]|nr:hypothetical protein [Acidobacteriota bacterium]
MKRILLLIPILILTMSCMHRENTKPVSPNDLASLTDLKILDVKPIEPVLTPNAMDKIPEKLLKETKVYTGTPVTLSFYKADIHDFFRAIAEVAKVNFLVHDQVHGNITIEVQNVPWDQLLDTVLQFNKLTSIRKGIIIEIIPRTLADKNTEVLKVNYGIADNIVKTLKGETGIGGSAQGSEIVADKRSNSIIITDIPENITKIKRIIAALDQQPQQVLLESVIAEITLDDTNQLGLGWSFGQYGRLRSSWGNNSFESSGTSNFPLNNIAEGTGFQYALSVNDGQVMAILNAYAQASKAKVLSHPKLVTYDNSEATMKVVERRFVQTSINTNTATGIGGIFSNFEERDYGIVLTVTPHINQAGDILLKVKQDVSDLTGVDSNGNPISTQRIIDTTLLLRNGQTMVLGGLIQEKKKNDTRGLPWFYKIPILRSLFGTREKENKRTELLLFITPHLIRNFNDAKAITNAVIHQKTSVKPLN